MNLEREETSGLTDALTKGSCGARQNQQTDGIQKFRMTSTLL